MAGFCECGDGNSVAIQLLKKDCAPCLVNHGHSALLLEYTLSQHSSTVVVING